MRVQDEVEQLLKDLYPTLDVGIIHTDCDDLLEEEQNVEFFFTAYRRISSCHYTTIQKLQSFPL